MKCHEVPCQKDKDFFHENIQNYLPVSNYFSKFSFVMPVNYLSFKTTSIQLNQILPIQGLLREVFVDSGPLSTVKMLLHSLISGDSCITPVLHFVMAIGRKMLEINNFVHS